MVVEYKTEDSDYCLIMKGTPEKIWSFSKSIYINGKKQEINEKWHQEFKTANLIFGKGGERVLGFARLHLPRLKFPLGYEFKVSNPGDYNFPYKDMVFTGLVSLVDPPRDAVPFAVQKCKAAGIKVIMVTGDQPVTAAAIARLIHIIKDKTADEIAEEEKIPLELAMKKANALVIHGDMLTKAMQEEEMLPES